MTSPGDASLPPPDPPEYLQADSLGTSIVARSTFHENIDQEIIVTTADKLRICLMNNASRMRWARDWIAPASMTIAVLLVFVTADFKEALGFGAEMWEAFFLIVLVASIVWLLVALVRLRRPMTVDEVVNEVKKAQLATTPVADKD